MSTERRWIGSGVKSEEMFGYSRATRVGDRILVSATAASGPEGPGGNRSRGSESPEIS